MARRHVQDPPAAMAAAASSRPRPRAHQAQNQNDQAKKQNDQANKPKGRPGRNDTWMLQGRGRMLHAFTPAQLQEGLREVTSSNGAELLCTYSWASQASPAIYVPGAAPTWKPKDLPVTLPQDSGTQFIDQNAFRVPNHPFLPLFSALSITKPTYDLADVDVVTNRNSLRHLLQFAQGRVEKAFRIDLDLVDNTLFLTRRERSTRYRANGPQSRGYGHSFEKAFTEPETSMNSTSCHRTVRYNLGDLSCVVRFEVDACYEVKSEASMPETTTIDGGKDPATLLQSFARLSLPDPAYNPSGLQVIRGGRFIPCQDTAEIKTKSRKLILSDILPQLWFGRIPTVFLAQHANGTFHEIRQINAAAEFAKWEASQQKALRKMTQLISQLRDMVKEANRPCVATCDNRTRPLKLELFTTHGSPGVLPAQYVEQFWKKTN